MSGYITTQMSPSDTLTALREADGYFLCNNERDVSQSDFKNRLMPMTTVRVAPVRDQAPVQDQSPVQGQAPVQGQSPVLDQLLVLDQSPVLDQFLVRGQAPVMV